MKNDIDDQLSEIKKVVRNYEIKLDNESVPLLLTKYREMLDLYESIEKTLTSVKKGLK